jgi:hypothetical protein
VVIDPNVPDNGVDDLEALVLRQPTHSGAHPAEHLIQPGAGLLVRGLAF